MRVTGADSDGAGLGGPAPSQIDVVLSAALVRGVATVIASGLQVMGVEPVEEMR